MKLYKICFMKLTLRKHPVVCKLFLNAENKVIIQNILIKPFGLLTPG